jgi:hypothetical protein
MEDAEVEVYLSNPLEYLIDLKLNVTDIDSKLLSSANF